VHVLADAFNHMLDRLTEAFAGQRAFVADASHELRTPLTVISGQIELLATEQRPSAAEVRRVSALVQAEIARIGRLVDDLLLLAKAERPEFLRTQALDLRAYTQELWDATVAVAERRFELGKIPAGTLQADPDRLTQALRNLIANAIEHTAAPGGLVRLSAAELPRTAAGEPADRAAAGELRFVVDDDGPGIPADQREQVFDRFHRTDRARARSSGGAGLGLAIVRAIVQAHGGSVSAGESPEGGARMELTLPGFSRVGAPGTDSVTPASDEPQRPQDPHILAGHA
jgi:signal transduction histidine kinase